MVRTRIAPSPTGFPHIGTIYQSLFDYVYAKQQNGKFIVRIEDTDRNRFIEEAEEVIYSALDWFNLTSDENSKIGGPYGPYRQSERLGIYREYVDTLIENGHAYHCFCTKERLEVMRAEQEKKKISPMYDKHCRNLSQDEVSKNLESKLPYVIRMKVPENRKIVFRDLIIGDIEFDSNTIDDQVLLKADGFPTYHLAVVVDDHLMEITHIFRGKEWIPSAPKHVLLYEFFGWEMPVHAHLPLILSDKGKGKLSKRQGHASVDYYRGEGYLPEAVLNYLSNIVWNHPEGKEIYPIEEFIRLLDLQRVTSQGARFDLAKLDWMNGEYIRRLKVESLMLKVVEFFKGKYSEELVKKTIPLVQERIKTLKEYDDYCEFFIRDPESYEIELSEFKPTIAKVIDTLQSIDEKDWEPKIIGERLQDLATAENISFSKFFMSLRVAITGKKISPPLNECIEIMGKEKTIKRLELVITS